MGHQKGQDAIRKDATKHEKAPQKGMIFFLLLSFILINPAFVFAIDATSSTGVSAVVPSGGQEEENVPPPTRGGYLIPHNLLQPENPISPESVLPPLIINFENVLGQHQMYLPPPKPLPEDQSIPVPTSTLSYYQGEPEELTILPPLESTKSPKVTTIVGVSVLTLVAFRLLLIKVLGAISKFFVHFF